MRKSIVLIKAVYAAKTNGPPNWNGFNTIEVYYIEFWIAIQLMGDSPPHIFSGPWVLMSSKVTLEVDSHK